MNATHDAASDVPVLARSFTTTGDMVNFTLNFALETGAKLLVVQNIGLDFINGAFDNLTNRQAVESSFGGISYNFVANYYGGAGKDLVLA